MMNEGSPVRTWMTPLTAPSNVPTASAHKMVRIGGRPRTLPK